MNRDWLWDRKTSLAKIKRILKDPSHREFIVFAALLFARKNTPEEVFKQYIDPLVFCRHWPRIKKQMRKDAWASQRIVFWQAVYEKLLERYHKKGMVFRARQEVPVHEVCKSVGDELRRMRKAEGLSQKALAEKIGISQQLISRVEKGRENVSILTLENLARAFDKRVNVVFA